MDVNFESFHGDNAISQHPGDIETATKHQACRLKMPNATNTSTSMQDEEFEFFVPDHLGKERGEFDETILGVFFVGRGLHWSPSVILVTQRGQTWRKTI